MYYQLFSNDAIKCQWAKSDTGRYSRKARYTAPWHHAAHALCWL